jgi:2-oxo-4-hydroxy-4-carboxy-5-ureidoimidazoline decarboxylase
MAQAGGLTAASASEQSAAGLDRLERAESLEIERLNEAYKARFGFPFVICARLNAKETILSAMRARAGNTREAELSTALGEIAKIARLRLNDSVKKEN